MLPTEPNLPANDPGAEEDLTGLLAVTHQEELLIALEQERRRVAGLVQETITAQLQVILSQLLVYQQTMTANPQMQTAVSVLSTLVRQVIQQARDLEANLFSQVLDSLGLEPALEVLIIQEMRVRGVQIELNLQRMRERLPAQIELVLYRITQEQIERAVRHSGASHIQITLHREDHLLQYSLRDNGRNPLTAISTGTLQRVELSGGTIRLSHDRPNMTAIVIAYHFDVPVDLTEREDEILRLLAEGLTNKQIANQLHITVRTVKYHLDNLYSKLAVSSRTEAAIYALRRGIVRQPPVLKDR